MVTRLDFSGIYFSISALHFHHFLMCFYVSAFFQLMS
jgi:hypothetical protein